MELSAIFQHMYTVYNDQIQPPLIHPPPFSTFKNHLLPLILFYSYKY